MLELQNISFGVTEDNGTGSVDKEILNDINLTIEDNKFVVITGPNGGGKSTLAKIIAGIEKPTSGRILLDGQDITDKNITERAKASRNQLCFPAACTFQGHPGPGPDPPGCRQEDVSRRCLPVSSRGRPVRQRLYQPRSQCLSFGR